MLQIPDTNFWRPGTALQLQEKDRTRIREWLVALMDRFNIKARQVAIQAEVSPSTVYRALEEDGDFVMSTTTLSKIAGHFGVPMPTPGATGMPALRPQQQDADLATPENLAAGLEADIPAGHARMTVTNEVLNLEGIRPGDIVEFDLTERPKPGDIVAARVQNVTRGSSDMVMRIFRPPHLLTRSNDATVDITPLYVDNERVVIMGVWKRLFRERAS